MAMKLVPDRGGKTLRLSEIEGRIYPWGGEKLLQTFIDQSHAVARPDDIVVNTYPKSGTNWAAQIAAYLRKCTTDDDEIGKLSLLEIETPDDMEAKPSPRIFSTHYAADAFSTDFLRKKSKIIHVVRDPRDVVVSFFNHHKKLPHYDYDGEWKDYFPLFLEGKMDWGSWFVHTKGWEKLIKDNPESPILVLTFEDMKQDPKGCIKKVSKFIGGDHSDEFLEEVCKKTSFDFMKQQQEAGKGVFIPLRKGITGDWKNWFTVAQSEMFEEVFEREMPGTRAYQLYSQKCKN